MAAPKQISRFVRTPDDLGVQSEAPSHQELIDYLSAQFMEEGWSIKKMHKLIMMSNTYQQSSETNNVYARIQASLNMSSCLS